jgi:hypothetical protein
MTDTHYGCFYYTVTCPRYAIDDQCYTNRSVKNHGIGRSFADILQALAMRLINTQLELYELVIKEGCSAWLRSAELISKHVSRSPIYKRRRLCFSVCQLDY